MRVEGHARERLGRGGGRDGVGPHRVEGGGVGGWGFGVEVVGFGFRGWGLRVGVEG